MDPEPSQATSTGAIDESVDLDLGAIDESVDLDLGAIDFVLGFLTLPLLFWAALYAVSGHERLYATRAARLRLYLWLLAAEVVIVAALVWWVAR